MKKTFLGLLRFSLGWIFLWAFLDKTFGLYYSTVPENSWIAGGSPTTGFLSNATGTFAPYFNSLVGQAWVDWLFMLGLLGVGVALILGIGMKIATISGSLMMFLMYLAVFPLSNNPIIDDHIIYILALIVLYSYNAGRTLGLGRDWEETSLVKKYPILK